MIILTDDQVAASSDPLRLVDALRQAFVAGGETPSRLHLNLPGRDEAKLLVMPCWTGRDAIGVKVATVMPDNQAKGRPTVDGLYILMDGQTGRPRAILGAATLTALRTAAVCALATSVLSRPEASTLLMVGTGALAPHLIAAYLSVRPLQKIILWGRNPAKAEGLAQRLAALPVGIEVAADLETAVPRADIISCATLSREPLIAGCKVTAGAHIDLVGSFTPDMREADTDLFLRSRLIVDTATAFSESGDLITPVREGAIPPLAPDLSGLLIDLTLGRQSPAEVTVFKTVGTGLADLAAAQFIVAQNMNSNTAGEPGFIPPLAIG